jgi:ribosomal protein L44E
MGMPTSRGMSGITTQRLNSAQRGQKKRVLRVDCTHCHGKQVEIALSTSQLKDSEIGGNCSECGLFVLVDASREKVIS